MTEQPFLGLRLFGSAPDELFDALATVPGRFGVCENDDTDVADVAWSCGPAWEDAAGSGERCLVVDAGELPPDEWVETLAGRPVWFVSGYSHTPALLSFVRLVAKSTVDFVDLLVVEPRTGYVSEDALWRACALLADAGFTLDAIESCARTEHGLVANGQAGAARVHLSVVASAATPPSATIRAFTPVGALIAELGDPATAAPGQVVVVDAAGAHVRPTVYESSRRRVLLEVGAAANGGLPPSRLVDRARVVRLVREATWPGNPARNTIHMEGKEL